MKTLQKVMWSAQLSLFPLVALAQETMPPDEAWTVENVVLLVIGALGGFVAALVMSGVRKIDMLVAGTSNKIDDALWMKVKAAVREAMAEEKAAK